MKKNPQVCFFHRRFIIQNFLQFLLFSISKCSVKSWLMTTLQTTNNKYYYAKRSRIISTPTINRACLYSTFYNTQNHLLFQNRKDRLSSYSLSSKWYDNNDDEEEEEEIMNEDDNDDNDMEYEEEEEDDKIRIRARVAYDGTGFQGWQVQNNNKRRNNNNKIVRTIQGELQTVLSQRFQRNITVVGAGRTDSGVHARRQAIHFDLYPHEIKSINNVNTEEEEMKVCFSSLEHSLNRMLRRDVRIWNIGIAPIMTIAANNTTTIYSTIQERKKKWHVIFHSKSKLYSYRLCTGRAMNPNHRHTRVHFHDVPLSSMQQQKRMQHILNTFVGTHEFAAFAGQVEVNERKSGTKKNTIRTVYKIDLIDEGNQNYRIDIYLRGALYKMIRNMIGTALDVYRDKVSIETLQQMLQIHHHNHDHDSDDDNNINRKKINTLQTRTSNKSKPVPPEGLTMENVFFEDNDADTLF